MATEAKSAPEDHDGDGYLVKSSAFSSLMNCEAATSSVGSADSSGQSSDFLSSSSSDVDSLDSGSSNSGASIKSEIDEKRDENTKESVSIDSGGPWEEDSESSSLETSDSDSDSGASTDCEGDLALVVKKNQFSSQFGLGYHGNEERPIDVTRVEKGCEGAQYESVDIECENVDFDSWKDQKRDMDLKLSNVNYVSEMDEASNDRSMSVVEPMSKRNAAGAFDMVVPEVVLGPSCQTEHELEDLSQLGQNNATGNLDVNHDIEAAQHKIAIQPNSYGCCIGPWSDLELFFIVLIVVCAITLVILLVLLLVSRD